MGFGESTLLRLIKNELATDQRYLVVEVDPWPTSRAIGCERRSRGSLLETILTAKAIEALTVVNDGRVEDVADDVLRLAGWA